MSSFRMMSDDQRAELAQEGVKSQTPKAYFMGKSDGGNNNNNNNNSTLKLVLTNQCKTKVSYYISPTSDIDDFDEEELKKYELTPGKSVSYTKETVICLLVDDSYDAYSLDESGNYFINSDNEGLYIEIEGEENPEHDDSGQAFEKALFGKWKWEDIEGNANAVFTQQNLLTVSDSQGSSEYDWSVANEESDGETYSVLILSSEDEKGVSFEEIYYIDYIDTNTIQLYLIEYKENGEEVDLSDSNDDELIIMLYKK